MPNPVINRRLVGGEIINTSLDSFTYPPGSILNNLNGSNTGLTNNSAHFSKAFVSRGVFSRVYCTDDMASYTNGAAVAGLNGGIDFSSAYAALDTDAGAAWALQVVANGGVSPSSNSIMAVSAFYSGLVTDGLDSLMLAVNPFAPDNLIASMTPIPQLSPKGTALWTNHNFVLADLTVNGLKGDGSSKYIDPGITLSTDFPSEQNSGFVAYTFQATATGLTGGADDGTQYFEHAAKFSDNNYYSRSGLLGSLITGASPGAGYYGWFRVSSTDHRIFFANSGNAHAQLGATDSSSQTGSFPAIAAYLFVLQNNGSNFGFMADRLSFSAYTKGLTSTQSANLFNRIVTLRTSLGGGTV